MLRSLVVAFLMAVAPFAASAMTVSPASNIANGGTYDVSGGPFFWDATFVGGDGAGSVSFAFDNTSTVSHLTGVVQGTVLQFSGQFAGVTVSWGNGQSQTIAPGVSGIIDVSSLIARGASDILTVSWGAVTGSRANIDLDVQSFAIPVPLPASGLFLALGLAGLGFVRARRSAA